MAVDTHEADRSGLPGPSLLQRLLGVEWHDVLLAMIPLAFLAAIILAQVTSLSNRGAITVASIFAAIALIDALFVHPPSGHSRW